MPSFRSNIYYVKDIGIGLKSVINEILSARIGRLMGLPVAPFSIVYIDKKLLEYETRAEIRGMKPGFAFGSRKINGQWVDNIHSLDIQDDLKEKLLVFDYWIRNSDRNLTIYGGNSNLKRNNEDNSLIVFDHNMAFETNFNNKSFLETHIFKSQWEGMISDLFKKREYERDFQSILNQWNKITENLPQEWYDELDVEQDTNVETYLLNVLDMLKSYQSKDFWNV